MKRVITICTLLQLCFSLSYAQFTNGQSAGSVMGQNNYTTGDANFETVSNHRLKYPRSIAVNPVSGKVYIADVGNNRVLRYASTASLTNGCDAEHVLGQPDFTSNTAATTKSGMNNPYAIAVDGSENLYVADAANNRVLIFSSVDSKGNGADADVVLGQSVFTSNAFAITQSGMNNPSGVAVDVSGNLYVAERNNNRVLKFNAASKTTGHAADVVLGQLIFTTNDAACTAGGMNTPFGVAVDGSGNLFVVDNDNSRVLKFNAASIATGHDADVVLGQPNFTSSDRLTTQSGMRYPYGIAVDGSGNLFVADNGNNRVLKFNAASISTNHAADVVLGQSGFTTSTSATTQSGMDSPSGVAIDGSGNIFVADANNCRVLEFNNASIATGHAADVVLGQPDFVSDPNLNEFGLNDPSQIGIDPVSGAVFVADNSNNRVLRFANAGSYAAGAAALGVLGQPNLRSRVSATTRSGMNYPIGVAMDGSGTLYVADAENHRVLKFTNAVAKADADGADADGVLGQGGFITAVSATTPSGMNYPTGVAVDGSGNLYVADYENHRVLKFTNATAKADGANADGVLGQGGFVTADFATTPSGMNYPTGVAVDGSGNLYVADKENNRVLKFTNAATKADADGANADGVLGQTDFGTATDGTASNQMWGPCGVAVDGSGSLYVADKNNNRVLIFKNAAVKADADGDNADVVLGQSGFGLADEATTQSGMIRPIGVAVNSAAGKLYVSDGNNNRVLIFTATSALPVELTAFTAASIGSKVTLQWQTATEVNNYGFEVERRAVSNLTSPLSPPYQGGDRGGWENIGFVQGAGTSNSPKEYSFTDSKSTSGRFVYRLKQADNNGMFKYSQSVEVEVGSVPKEFSLHQNYPNPFNPTTVISYQLPVTSNVLLKVYDMLGRDVATLVNETKEAGSYEVTLSAPQLASGVYLCRLTAGGYSKTIKISLVR